MDNAKNEKCRIVLGMLSRLCENTMALIKLSELKGEDDMLSALKIVNYAKSGIDMIASESLADDEISDKHLVDNVLSTQTVKKPVIKYESVDLGLPSGLKWADRNVWAATPEAYGDYFMWGSMEPDTDKSCDWAHAPFNNGSEKFDKAYFDTHKSEWFMENRTLKPEYDAAHAIMGGSWRMPTSAEIQELLDGTTRSVEGLNGIAGMRFTAPNGNSIFMPFSGYRYGSDIIYVGSSVYAWSSSLNAGYADGSHILYFDSDGDAYVSNDYRYYGFVVRGVHD